jgi:hypothetical protein
LKNSIVRNWQDLLKDYVFSPDWTIPWRGHSLRQRGQSQLFEECAVAFFGAV